MKLPTKFVGLFFAVALSVPNVLPHTIWIEPMDDQMVIRFAEPGSKFEKSPGHLDSLTHPVSFTLNLTNAAVSIDTSKKADHFLLVAVTATNVLCAESIFTVRGGRKPYFYARWQPEGAGAGEPLLTMDIVPTGKPGEARAYLRGKPMSGVKATLRGPDEKEIEVTANNDGLLRFDASKSGQYLLTIAHQREPIPGFHVGRSFSETSHNAALSWTQSSKLIRP